MSLITDIKSFKESVKTFFPKNKLEFTFLDEFIKIEIHDYKDMDDITFPKLIEFYNWLYGYYRFRIGRIAKCYDGIRIYLKEAKG